MAKTVTVSLETPITSHNGPVTQVTIREPNGRDYIELGEPAVFAQTASKTAVLAENDTAIKGYIQRCITEPNADIVMAQVGLTDMMKIKQEILGFFQAARAALSVDGLS